MLIRTLCLLIPAGVFLIYFALKLLVTSGSSKQIDHLVELTAEVCGRSFSASSTSAAAQKAEAQSSDLEADDYEVDGQEDGEDGENWETEGVERHATSGRGRRGEGYSGINLKKTNVVRIISSDPSSSLSTSPLQLDLDNGTDLRRNGVAGGVKGVVRRANAATTSNSSPNRKRRESGKLTNGSPSSSPNLNARPSSPAEETDGNSSLSALARSDPGTPIASDTWNLNSTSEQAEQNLSRRRTSLHGVTGLNRSPLLPASILKTRPEQYCGAKPPIQEEPTTNTSLYPDSRGKFGTDAFGLSGSGGYSSASAYLPSGQRSSTELLLSPSIASPFLQDGSSLNSSSSTSPASSSPAQSPPQENLSIGLGLNTHPHPSWPTRRMKQIKLMEPDWSPYVQSHERAR